MDQINICLIGFGNVGKAFAQLLDSKSDELCLENIHLRITAIATGGHGNAINLDGINAENAISAYQNGDISSLSSSSVDQDIAAFIRASKADFLVETSPVNYESGQPATMHIETALKAGMHAVSANKGPVVHAYQALTDFARINGKRFLFESAVMDGAPVFSVFREALPAANILGFEGILNSCTNLLIEQMETGQTFDQAVAFAQSIGIAETDPSGDIDGWDAAIKIAALVTVLMQHPLKPQDVDRKGIREITPASIKQAAEAGKRWKLVCRANMENGKINASVQPELVAATSPLFAVNGTSSLIVFKTDVLPGLGILESNPGPETTAYGLLADLLNILKLEK
jgi:homoserine dehydrogenase